MRELKGGGMQGLRTCSRMLLSGHLKKMTSWAGLSESFLQELPLVHAQGDIYSRLSMAAFQNLPYLLTFSRVCHKKFSFIWNQRVGAEGDLESLHVAIMERWTTESVLGGSTLNMLMQMMRLNNLWIKTLVWCTLVGSLLIILSFHQSWHQPPPVNK